MTVQPGEAAPGFHAQVTDGREVHGFTLAEHLGEGAPIVLAFFPFAFTSVCEEQLLDLKRNLDALQEHDALVFGLSVDSPFTLRAYHQEHAFGFPLISDFNRQATEAYDLEHESLLGLDRPAKRATIVIAPDGTIAWAWITDDPEEKPSIDEILSVVRMTKAGDDPLRS